MAMLVYQRVNVKIFGEIFSQSLFTAAAPEKWPFKRCRLETGFSNLEIHAIFEVNHLFNLGSVSVGAKNWTIENAILHSIPFLGGVNGEKLSFDSKVK